MAKLLPLSAAVEEVVRDGDKVAFGEVLATVPANAFYEAWDPIARDRDGFTAWVKANILEQDPEASARFARR
jgi:hypothetical protein